ncbi:MAG: hypothetical protein IKO19_09285, partial [Candidatus Riflebacteria bacterium]|nr:hypothetical protein [Candidatus Riflebacteria bacterium]
HSIWESIPENVGNYLTTNNFSKTKKNTEENKKKIFGAVSTSIIADNHSALEAAGKYLEDYDFKLFYYPRAITGEASEEAKEFFFYVSKLKKDNLDPFAVISGGEPVVTFKRNSEGNNTKTENSDNLDDVPRNSFKSVFKSENIASLGEELRQKQLKSIVAGGRDQEFALAMLKYYVEFPDRPIFFLAAGTDGIDGPTDAAGVIINSKTVENAMIKSLNYEESLNKHDSYNFFKKAGGLIKTGYTGTNVNDIFIALVPPQLD